MARSGDDTHHAIAVQDGADLRLFMWVKRAAKGDVYVFWKTTDDDWTPHATYHVDGTRHLKSHGRDRILTSKGQPLTAAFVGSEQLISTPISLDVVRRRNKLCVAEDYADVVRIPAASLDATQGAGRTAVAVDLVAPGAAPVIYPPSAEQMRTVITDAIPHISVTLWDQTLMLSS